MILDNKYWQDFCRKTGMPLDQTNLDDSWTERARFDYKYCLWPRRCYKSRRLIWLTLAMRGRAVWTGPGEPAIEDRWYHRDEGLMIMIKKVSETWES